MVHSHETGRSGRESFREIFADAPAAAGVIDSYGRWLETNHSLRQVCGRSAEEFRNHDLSSMLLPPTGAAILQQIQSIVRGERQAVQSDVTVVRPDGSLTAGFLQVFPYPSGAAGTFLLLLTDVSGHRPFRTVVERSSMCVFIYGRNGLEYANPRFAECFGYQLENITPDSLEDFIVEDDRADAISGLGSVLAGEKDGISLTARMRTREGPIVPIELRVAASQFEGRRAVIGTAVDITSRIREREEEMRVKNAVEDAAREWRMIFDTVETPLIVAHGDGRIDRINRAARMIAGTSYDEIVGKTISDLGAGQPWALVTELVGFVAASLVPIPGQVVDEIGRTWDILAVPFDSNDVADDRVTVIAWDVTQVVALRTLLDNQVTMAAMGKLLGGVAHEVRNPLFAISATLDALEDASGGAHADFFTVLRAEIERMTRLMQDLLTFGRPAAPQLEEANVETAIDAAMTLSQTLARDRGVELVKRLQRAPKLLIDRERVTRMLQNVIANAVQHSEPQSRVVVEGSRTRKVEGSYEIRILDRGPGFSEEDIPHVFDPFFSRRKGGTGLGLSIVDQIAAEHHGSVAIANRRGGGAIVTIRLPLLNSGTSKQK